jgi:type 1 fimbriae regulatory protein FimB/type 1 fimbriae regulatory protein FimE
MPRRKPNSVYRTREHLTGAEVDRLIDAAKANRWGHRDATMRQCANATPFSRLNATEQ